MSKWILLRGLTREARHWGDFRNVFRATMPDACTFALDLPGCGVLNRIPSPASIEGIAALVRSQARALGIEPPYRLLALSLGAMAAVAWATTHPGDVEACVLINTSMRPFGSLHERLRPPAAGDLARLALPGAGDREREEAILRLTSSRAEELHEVVESWIAYRRDRPVSRANALRQLIAAARFRAPPERPRARILVLASAGDALVHPDCSRRIARAWRTDFAEHPGAGHDLPLDDGPWVAAQIREWLDDTAAIPAAASPA